jgi:hypothetical protein
MEKLFDINEVGASDPVQMPNAMALPDDGLQLSGDMRLRLQFNELFPDLDGEMSYHFVSYGDWSLYHLADFILSKIGPARLYLSTWSISEFSARKLTEWKQSGLLTHIYGLVDARTENRHEAAFQLCKQQFTEMRIFPTHAKVCVFISETAHISIVGSANWTENMRIEAGVLCTGKALATRHAEWISNMVEQIDFSL